MLKTIEATGADTYLNTEIQSNGKWYVFKIRAYKVLYPQRFYSNDVSEVFDDIKSTDWWYSPVQYVYENGIMVGNNVSFKPTSSLTREEFVQVLYNINGQPEVFIENKFHDVKEDWYKNAVLWANDKSITVGLGSGIFGIGKDIMRQDLAVMLHRYAVLKDYDLSTTDGVIHQYADSKNVSSYAEDAMNWAITQGIISGKGNARLDPLGTATRAECATMIMRLLETNK